MPSNDFSICVFAKHYKSPIKFYAARSLNAGKVIIMRVKIKDNKTAFQIYNNNIEIGTSEIMALFGCCRNTANKLKKIAREYQGDSETFSDFCVNTDIAYKAWKIDINAIEMRLLKVQKLTISR